MCTVEETGACASDAECMGSRLCTRSSSNPDEDYVCSGDSGCEQVRLASGCPSAYPHPTLPRPRIRPTPGAPLCAAAACGRTGPPRRWCCRLNRMRRPRCASTWTMAQWTRITTPAKIVTDRHSNLGPTDLQIGSDRVFASCALSQTMGTRTGAPTTMTTTSPPTPCAARAAAARNARHRRSAWRRRVGTTAIAGAAGRT